MVTNPGTRGSKHPGGDSKMRGPRLEDMAHMGDNSEKDVFYCFFQCGDDDMMRLQ